MNDTPKAPPGFFYDPFGDLTRHKPIKAVWIETLSRFWRKDTFTVVLDYEDADWWRWTDFPSRKEAETFRDKLIECIKKGEPTP